MDLKCKRLDCKYNNQYACMAKGILVKNTLTCETYQKRTDLPQEQQQDVGKTMWDEVPTIHPFRHSLKINIECNAKCLFNKEGKCIANGITIATDNKKPICFTHIKP